MPARFTALTQVHPAYAAQVEEWTRNTRRMTAGLQVYEELIRFDWEVKNGEHYRNRQRQATYLNFPDRFATLLVGHMMREAPTPSFGTLGEIRRERDINDPTDAELFYFNVDGIGADGTQWNPWWTYVGKKAVNTGLEWLYVEGPRQAPGNRANLMRGQRPFLRNYSPIAVPNWHYEDGALAFVVIKRRRRRPGADREGMAVNNQGEVEYLFLCRRGYDAFDSFMPFSEGGWFRFNANLEYTGEHGFWDATRGEIPMVPLFYDRLKADDSSFRLARSGTTELGNAAVSYMNLASAADYDAWDAAQSVQALAGVDEAGFNLFIRKVKEGNKYAPLTQSQDSDKVPQIIDASMGAIVAQVFDMRLKAKREEAMELMLNEVKRGPDTSGTSLQASFSDSRSPRLALFAGEIESAQNAVIHFVEMLWGNANPQGEVKWKREFKLLDPLSSAREFYEIVNLSKVRSPTLDVRIMEAAADSRAFLKNDEEHEKVLAELRESAEAQMELNVAPVPTPGTAGAPGSNGAPGTPGRPGREVRATSQRRRRGSNGARPNGNGSQS